MLKCHIGLVSPSFAEITDDVLDVDQDYRRTMLMHPPHVPGSISPSAPIPASLVSVPVSQTSATVPVTQSSGHQTHCSMAWTSGQQFDPNCRSMQAPDMCPCHISAQAHLAETEDVPDVPDSDPPPDSPPCDTTSADFAALGIASHVSSPIHNTDFYFEQYNTCYLSSVSFMITPVLGRDHTMSSPLLDFIADEGPIAFVAFQQCYNTILDSGCTNHIFHDCLVFWSYDPDHAVSVQTANCGTLHMLAWG